VPWACIEATIVETQQVVAAPRGKLPVTFVQVRPVSWDTHTKPSSVPVHSTAGDLGLSAMEKIAW